MNPAEIRLIELPVAVVIEAVAADLLPFRTTGPATIPKFAVGHSIAVLIHAVAGGALLAGHYRALALRPPGPIHSAALVPVGADPDPSREGLYARRIADPGLPRDTRASLVDKSVAIIVDPAVARFRSVGIDSGVFVIAIISSATRCEAAISVSVAIDRPAAHASSSSGVRETPGFTFATARCQARRQPRREKTTVRAHRTLRGPDKPPAAFAGCLRRNG